MLTLERALIRNGAYRVSADLTLAPGSLNAVIGPSGAGKTTLLHAVAGFLPRSIEILAGTRRNPPLVVHIHAALIVSWLGMLVAQTWLAARARTAWHRTLGTVAFALGPAVVLSMIAVTIWRFGERLSLGQDVMGANTLLTQARSIIYFSLFFTLAMVARRRDPETHKRMWTASTLNDGKPNVYGLGWRVAANGRVYHGGSQQGAATYLVVDPKAEVVVAVLANTEKANVTKLAQVLLSAILEQRKHVGRPKGRRTLDVPKRHPLSSR